MISLTRPTWLAQVLSYAAMVLAGPWLGWSAAVRAGEVATSPSAGTADDPLLPWRHEVRVHPVSATPGRHTIHSYYVCNPESPDGRRVLFYASTAANGYVGEICVLDRETGRETVLARDVHVEDAHRAACQQWISNGRRIAFHEVREGRWRVVVVDADTGAETAAVEDRQLAFGQPHGDLLPIYGCHWNPGRHRNLELLDAATGQLRTAVTIDAVQQQYPDWLKTEFGDKPVSVFFPVLSPDQKRVFFKMAAGSGGNEYMSKKASHRQGLITFDLEHGRFLFLRGQWGHPAWHPDSRRILEVGNIWLNADNGATTRIPDLPRLRGCHPAVSPGGRLLVMDGLLDTLGGEPGEWGVVVADARGGRYEVLHRFDNRRGTRSWRRSDPHPVFSADGRRTYFNVSSDDETQLYVAEAS